MWRGMTSSEQLLGLFPLGIVLLPGEIVPLHIFEERYKLLVNERADDGEFGIVLAEDDGCASAGCTARVVDIVERLDDGRMNILVQGAAPLPARGAARARRLRRPSI